MMYTWYHSCFVPNMSILESLFGKQQEGPHDEKRHSKRIMCAVVTELADTRGEKWSCKIVDMSESGLGIVTSARLMIGTTVDIFRPSVLAEVVWAGENKAGLRIVR
jgi:hypothetical protein